MYSRTDEQPSLFPAARRIAIALVALVLVMFLPTAHAADKGTQPPPAADTTEDPAYLKAIEEGLAEYDAHHFEEARSLFRRAHEISPNARTFRGIGVTSFELRDYVTAVHYLSAALKEERKPLPPEKRKHTQGLLDRSHMFVDVYTLTISPQNAHVIVDGHAPEYEPDGTLMLSLGSHTLDVRAHGMVARSLPIDVHGGEKKELSVTLEPLAPEPVASPEAAPVATAAEPLPPPVMSNVGAAAWLIAGGATALLSGGAGYYLYTRQTQLDSCHNPAPGYQCTNESSIKTWRNVALGTTIGTGAAALTMALIGILSWHSAPAASQTHSALDCSVSPLGIACGRSF
jgi:hypothetical protein